MIPSVEACFRLMGQYRMLENIRDHSLVVARIAQFIARGLKDAGFDISLKKTIAGALLHDIGKTASLKSGEDHTELGKRICIENNYHEIADIVKEHVRLNAYDLNGTFSEKVVVYYSDKRVNHDEIVSLEKRMAYIMERYALNQRKYYEAIKSNFDKCKRIETKIFDVLKIRPSTLNRWIKHEKIDGCI